MGKRSFNRSQRQDLYVRARGNCEACGETLRRGWHAHHIKPFSEGGETETNNGMALCVSCHKQIHKREHEMKKFKPRRCQLGAKNKFKEVIGQGRESFLAELAPGSGKTLLVADIADDLLNANEIDHIVIFVPTRAIMDGFVISWFDWFNFDIYNNMSPGDGLPKDEVGTIVTYQGAPSRTQDFKVWEQKLGGRILWVFDEIHHCAKEFKAFRKKGNKWGEQIAIIEGLRGYKLFLTGTPYRTDEGLIPGLNYTKDKDGSLIVQPDYVYSFAEAAGDGVITNVNVYRENGEVCFEYDGERKELKISEASAYDSGRAIKTAVYNDDYILPTLERLYQKTMDHRKLQSDAAGLIVCKDVAHANHIRDKLFSITKLPKYKIQIVTSDDTKASRRIQEFKKNPEQLMIIAVDMIAEGVDIPRLRTGALLRNIKSELKLNQLIPRLMRTHPTKEKFGSASWYFPPVKFMMKIAGDLFEQVNRGITEADESEGPGEGLEKSFNPLSATHFSDGLINRDGLIEQKSLDQARRIAELYNVATPPEEIIKFIRDYEAIGKIINGEDYEEEKPKKREKPIGEEKEKWQKKISSRIDDGLKLEGFEYYKDRKAWTEAKRQKWIHFSNQYGKHQIKKIAVEDGLEGLQEYYEIVDEWVKELEAKASGNV